VGAGNGEEYDVRSSAEIGVEVAGKGLQRGAHGCWRTPFANFDADFGGGLRHRTSSPISCTTSIRLLARSCCERSNAASQAPVAVRRHWSLSPTKTAYRRTAAAFSMIMLGTTESGDRLHVLRIRPYVSTNAGFSAAKLHAWAVSVGASSFAQVSPAAWLRRKVPQSLQKTRGAQRYKAGRYRTRPTW